LRVISMQRINELEDELSRQLEIVAELSKELSAVKDHKQEINELRLIVTELRAELRRAKDSESKTQSRNTELSQALDNKEGQLEVSSYCGKGKVNCQHRFSCALWSAICRPVSLW
jgi:uncharacterized coiled-coil protein SlyX